MPRASLRTTVTIAALLVLAASTPGRMQPQDAPGNLAPEMVLQFGHAGAITKLVVSEDGRRLMSIGGDFTVRLWELPGGQLLRTMREPSGESFRSAFFRDPEKPVVLSLARATMSLRDVVTGEAVASWPNLARDTIDYRAVALTPDGSVVATRADFKGAPMIVYSTKPGATPVTIPAEMVGGSILGVSADGGMMANALGRWGQPTDLWDLRTARKLFEIPDVNASAHAWLAASPTFTPDNRSLIIAGQDGALRFWDVRTGELRRTLTDPQPPSAKSFFCTRPCITAIAISADGRWLATGAEDSTVSLWDIASGRQVQRVRESAGAVYAVAIGPGGQWFASGGGNYDINIFDTATGRRRVLATHPDLVQTVTCAERARSCAFGTNDKRVRLWNATTGRELTLSGHTSQVNAVAFSGDGRWLASGSGDKTIRIWNAASGAALRTLPGHARAVSAVAISADGRTVASGDIGGDVKLWDLDSGTETRSLRTAKAASRDDHRVVALRFNANGRDFSVVYGDEGVVVFDLASGTVRRSFGRGAQAAAFTADDRFVAMLYSGVEVWNAADGSLVRTLPHGVAFLQSVAISRDGRWLASASADTTIRLWDTRTWAESTLRGHQGFVKSVAFAPDERRLISGSGDGTVRIWDVASKRQMAVVAAQKGAQSSVVVSPTGLFDGTADSMQQVAWRAPNTLDVAPLDAFFTDFFKPGLFADLMAGEDPAPPVDFAAVVQVPGLRTLLAQKQAHIETRNGRPVVCFAEPPRVAADVPVTERQLRPRVIHGFRIDPGDRTCPYQKELAATGPNPGALAERLSNWKPDRVATAWDGKRSTDTGTSTLHVFVAGVGDYPPGSGFDRLPYAAPSARAIESFFRQQGRSRSPFAAVRVWDGLYDARATRDALRQRLAEMARTIKENDIVLLYLAGHGVVSSGQEMFYFVPIDGRDADLRGTGVNTAMLADGIRGLEARRVVLFIDACQSGGAIEPLTQIAAVKAQVEARRAKQEPQAAGHEHGVGVHLIAATLPLSYAVQIAQDQSALAATVLAALQQGQEITVGQVATYLSQHLADASARVAAGFRQVPLIDSVGLDFPIARR